MWLSDNNQSIINKTCFAQGVCQLQKEEEDEEESLHRRIDIRFMIISIIIMSFLVIILVSLIYFYRFYEYFEFFDQIYYF